MSVQINEKLFDEIEAYLQVRAACEDGGGTAIDGTRSRRDRENSSGISV